MSTPRTISLVRNCVPSDCLPQTTNTQHALPSSPIDICVISRPVPPQLRRERSSLGPTAARVQRSSVPVVLESKLLSRVPVPWTGEREW
jgi:hypothetical protein